MKNSSLGQEKERERPFAIEELFFSTTDQHGKLSSWNHTFARISGFTDQELRGAPHSLIRHHDMPRGVFQLFWDTIQEGKSIGAYVKNKAKDGSYYWVYALAMPIEGGYLSIRLKPSDTFLPVVVDLYRELLEFEKSLAEGGMKKSDYPQRSKAELLKRLSQLGFPHYEAFMEATLPVELANRNRALALLPTSKTMRSAIRSESARVSEIREHLTTLFNQFYLAQDLSKRIKEDFACIQELGSAIMLGSLNASIEAARLGEMGRVLHVLADYLGTSGSKIINELSEAQVRCHDSLSDVSKILFIVSSALLETEIVLDFLSEVESASEYQCIDRTAVLLSCFHKGIEQMLRGYPTLEHALQTVIEQFKDIQKLFLSLKIAQVSAKAEANRLSIDTHFRDVFEQVYSFVDSAKDKISHVNNEIERYLADLQERAESHQVIKAGVADLNLHGAAPH